MTAVTQADSTYAFIEKKVRRLTASPSESSLSSEDIQKYINTFYDSDFPYAIKLDQTRQIYKFLTIPNVDRYPVDVNSYQGFRAPVYFEGIQGNFFKNRDQLYNLYPRYPTKFIKGVVPTTGTITSMINGSDPLSIFSLQHGLSTGAFVTISDVLGAVELNGNTYQITKVNNNRFTLNGVNGAFISPYISGGTWVSASASFTLFGNNENPYPSPNFGILSTQVVIGGIDINGNAIRIIDDGGAVNNGYGIGSNTTTGQLIYVQQNTVGDNVYLDIDNATNPPIVNQIPSIPQTSPLGGQNNANYSSNSTLNTVQSYPPSPLTPQYCGTVNYITTQIEINFPVAPAEGTQITIWAAQYQPGRPYNLLFWNNEFTIRPVPDGVYVVEVEAYQTPSQFMMTNQSPVLNQWAQYIAYGAAAEILRDRQDMEGVQNLMEGFQKQEAQVLERQAIEEIGQPNITMFNTTSYGYGVGYGIGQGF